MRAEILSIGTEIMLGEIVDTNAAYIAARLPAYGIDLLYVSQVGDNPGRLAEVVQRAWQRSDLVIATGGLGPTEDDITRETVAEALGDVSVVGLAARGSHELLLAQAQRWHPRLVAVGDPAVAEQLARLLEALHRVNEVVQTQRGVAADERVRVQVAEHDQVIALARALQSRHAHGQFHGARPRRDYPAAGHHAAHRILHRAGEGKRHARAVDGRRRGAEEREEEVLQLKN